MKFPINDRICSELLSDYYQRLEDFVKLTSEHYLQIDYYIKSIHGKEWHSGRVNYDEFGKIIREDNFNQVGELVDSSKYEFSEKSVTRKSNDERSVWKFDKNNFLIEEVHEYDFDRPDFYKFTLNDQNRLIKINDEIQLIWEENEPTKLIKVSNSEMLKSVLKKTASESSVLNNKSDEITTYKYDNYGRLAEIISGNRITSFNYFGYDMMTGSEVKTTIENQVTYKAYNEEKLIDNKTVESVTKFFDDGMNLSRTVREIKLMK